MTGFPVELQLNVDTSRATLADTACRWLNQLIDALVGPARTSLAGLPADLKLAHKQLAGGGLLGEIVMRRWIGDELVERRRTLSDAGMEWLHAELSDPPQIVSFEVGDLDSDGDMTHRYLNAQILATEESPGWLQLCFYVPSQQFLDPNTGADTQLRYAELFRGLADTVNPGFGQVGYYYQPSATALEKMANRKKVGREHWDPAFTVGRARQILRGYSWITVVAQELADRLGGAEGLTETGAFAEVRQLAAGGVWLLATPDFRDWTEQAAQPVFRALAPVLPEGEPFRYPLLPSWPPHVVVYEDPARYR